jgi:hypothetical protein
MQLLLRLLLLLMMMVMMGLLVNAAAAAAAAKGGVIEALLEPVICCPLVQLLLEPDGAITVLATQDKILHEGFSSPGSTFPSSFPILEALHQAALAAGGLFVLSV